MRATDGVEGGKGFRGVFLGRKAWGSDLAGLLCCYVNFTFGRGLKCLV